MFKIVIDVFDLQRLIRHRLTKESNEHYIAKGGVDLSGAVADYLCKSYSIPCTHLKNVPAPRYVSYLYQRDLDELFAESGLDRFFINLNIGQDLIEVNQKDGFIIIEGKEHVGRKHFRTDFVSRCITVNL